MRVLVTGSQGFIGKNLTLRLQEQPGHEVLRFDRGDSLQDLAERVAQCDAVVHLAGENRPADPAEFMRVNAGLTEALCAALAQAGRPIPLLLASSSQAELDNPYGHSKRVAEEAVTTLSQTQGVPVRIYRLPGVFGKWCRPSYNSVVATFAHRIARDEPVQINDPSTVLRLVYIDDLVSEFLRALAQPEPGLHWGTVAPEYRISLGELAAQLEAFKNVRSSLVSERVGTGLTRALYATYVSYLPPDRFAYDLPRHGDARGVFVEMLKTPDAGQFSYFTAHPGVTRGGHYHHSKTEKFLVIKGQARFGFRHMLTQERYEIITSGEQPQVVETVPGWTHDITNIGDTELLVMLWANEIFDRERPDTLAQPV
ncbi:NAD-dependent epimerase/dehydratase family protein [Curvibacter sp. RS43]|uniref:UDP-2-acetamido-2,6-beta-L-arabino-hexul-4-ose reductase n=1 Tax=Curvibacter microcysteis TaxID=3026419 RepID=UPI002362D23F|nr:NAD-dependent epimerase/dehydratase family protein [Curvibacter sp. RS43]MDD0808771.1 NAD-dependent epimerase/dehydratase family protein [Curvibacter sp. RS43]